LGGAVDLGRRTIREGEVDVIRRHVKLGSESVEKIRSQETFVGDVRDEDGKFYVLSS